MPSVITQQLPVQNPLFRTVSGNVIILALPARDLKADQLEDLQGQLRRQEVGDGQCVVFDFTHARQVDHVLLSPMLALARKYPGRVFTCCLSDSLVELYNLAGYAKQMRAFVSRDMAIGYANTYRKR